MSDKVKIVAPELFQILEELEGHVERALTMDDNPHPTREDSLGRLMEIQYVLVKELHEKAGEQAIINVLKSMITTCIIAIASIRVNKRNQVH